MRISDWISDVCSSDLVGKSEIEGGHRILQPIEGQIPSQQAEGPRPRFESVDPPARMSCGFAKLDRVPAYVDRKSGVSGKSVSVRVDLGGRGIIKKKKNKKQRVHRHKFEHTTTE